MTREVKINITDRQLNSLLKVNSKEERRFSLSKLVDLTQLMSLLVAGLWAYHEWKTFQQKNELLTLQQQSLSNDVAKTTIKLQQIDLNNRTSARFTVDDSLQVIKVSNIANSNDAIYKVWVKFTIKNTSDSPFTVLYNITELFLADPMRSIREGGKNGVYIPYPPSVPDRVYNVDGFASKFWGQSVEAEAFAYQDSDIDPMITSAGYKPILGGGGTDVLQAGEISSNSPEFLVKAKRDAWLGVAITFGFDDNRYHDVELMDSIEPASGESSLARWHDIKN